MIWASPSICVRGCLFLLVFKTAATKEFPHDRGGRDELGINGLNELNDAEKSLCFGIFWFADGHLFQKGFCIGAQQSKFIEESRVEHDVGIFLIREYVFHLASADTTPTFEGV